MKALALREAETKAREEIKVNVDTCYRRGLRSELEKPKKKAAEEARERSLAEAAQAALPKRA